MIHKRRIAILFKFALSTSILQISQLVTSLAIIRLMPIHDFAVYVLYSAAWALGNQILDFGIPASIMKLVGSESHNVAKINRYIAAGLQLRIPLVLVVSSICLPFLYVTSIRAHISTVSVVILGSALVITFTLSAQKDILSIPLLMQGRIMIPSNADSTAEALRLIGVICLMALKLLTPVSLAILSVLSLMVSLYIVNMSSTFKWQDQKSQLNTERKQIISSVVPLIPNILFGAFQGQITVLLSSLIGSTVQLASVGALERLATILNFLKKANPVLIGPRIAKLTEQRLWRNISYIIGASSFLTFIIIGVGFWFPDALLRILGENYVDLGSSVGIVISTMALGYLISVMGTVSRYQNWRNWNQSAFFIVLIISLQAYTIATHDMRTVSGILLLGLASNCARLTAQSCVLLSARFRPSLFCS